MNENELRQRRRYIRVFAVIANLVIWGLAGYAVVQSPVESDLWGRLMALGLLVACLKVLIDAMDLDLAYENYRPLRQRTTLVVPAIRADNGQGDPRCPVH